MINFNDMDKCMTSGLNFGSFVASGKKPNVMTASWGFFGVMWHKKIVIVPIRESRFTKSFVDETGEFTLSIPTEGDMKEALHICGTKSGRDTDKISEAHLEMIKAKNVDTYVVGGCGKYFECKVIQKVEMPHELPDDIRARCYKTPDYHTYYFGEVVAEY